MPASDVTITFGFGPSLFGTPGAGDRFKIATKRPPELVDIPPLPGDQLDPARSGGDIGVQACADDPQVAFHAIRNLARIGRGKVVLRWTQLGFGRTSSTSNTQETPRNLQGFKDGTNIRRGPYTDCDSFGLGYHSQGINVHCGRLNSSNYLWVYLVDTSTGVAGWSRIDALNWDGSPIPDCRN